MALHLEEKRRDLSFALSTFCGWTEHPSALWGLAARLTLPVEDFPRYLVLPHLQPPKITSTSTTLVDQPILAQPYYDSQEFDAFLARYAPLPPEGEAIAFNLGQVNNQMFMRFIAKIAHGFALGEIGFEGLDPLLPDIILGRNNLMGDYIGCSSEDPLDRGSIFDLRLGNITLDKKYVAAAITLWPTTNSPLYTAIAGIEDECL